MEIIGIQFEHELSVREQNKGLESKHSNSEQSSKVGKRDGTRKGRKAEKSEYFAGFLESSRI